MWSVDPGCTPGAHQAALSLPSSAAQWGAESKMGKKSRGSRYRQFNKVTAQAACESKGKQKIYSLLPISRRCPATSREAGLQQA